VTVEVEIDGRCYRVELEPAGDRWAATVNGRRFDVDAARTPAGWSLLIGGPAAAGDAGARHASYETAVDDRGTGTSIVHVNGQAIEARVIDPRAWRRARQAADEGGSRVVTSAMAGRVVRVLVNPGDRVSARQGLIVVEAMKMENELRAPVDAVVRDVRVREGASVDAGVILIVLE
jgi:biotin carboxyl carrier protein